MHKQNKTIKFRVVAWDHKITQRLQLTPPQLRPFFIFITFFGGVTFSIIATIGMMLLLRANDKILLSNAFFAIGGIMALGGILKYVWRRQRPDTEYARNMLFASYSFPSGHTLDSILLYGLISYAITTHYPNLGAIVWATAIITIILVAYSRIYLGAHYVLDVIAGALLGTTFLAALLLLIN